MKELKPYLKNQILKPLIFIIILSFSLFLGYESFKVHSTSLYLIFFISLILTTISLLDLIFIYKRIQPILNDLEHIYNKEHSFVFQEFKIINESHELSLKNKKEFPKNSLEIRIDNLLHDLKFPLNHLRTLMNEESLPFYHQIESLLGSFKEDYKEIHLIHLPDFLLNLKKDYSKICTLNLEILDLNLFIKSDAFQLRRIFINIIENFLKRNENFIHISLFKRDDFIHGKISGKKSFDKNYPLKPFYRSENLGTAEFESFFKNHHGQFKTLESDDIFSYHFNLKRSFPPKNFSNYLPGEVNDSKEFFYPDFISLYKKEISLDNDFYLLDNDFSFSSLFTQYALSKDIKIYALDALLDTFHIPNHSYLLLDYHLLDKFSTFELAEKLKETKFLKIYLLTGDESLHQIPKSIQGLIYKKDLNFLMSNLKIILNSQKSSVSH